jgi:hypothetical protein
MRIATILIALMMALVATPVLSAQTPATLPASGPLMQLSLDELPAEMLVTTGMVRTIHPAGASSELSTGSGPSLHYVESGTLTIATSDSVPPLVISTGTPEAAPSGPDIVVVAGDGFLLAPGTTAEIRNDRAEPAAILDLIAAPDATASLGEAITREILVSQEVPLPSPTVTVTLSLDTIGPGDRVTFAGEPAITFFAPVDRSQAFSLSAQGANRFTDPVAVYILVIAPEASPPS